YWGIVVNLALCDTLDGILERNGEERRAPRTLAKVAGIVWIGAYAISAAIVAVPEVRTVSSVVMPLLTGGLWLTYMVRCDEVRAAVARIGDDTARLGPPVLSKIKKEGRGRILLAVVVWVFFALWVVACWQILAPAERPVHSRVAPTGT
ncbi:MAG TPA: hypothetical protein VIF09_26050, partial [Polyangiaceae bacterium]